MAPLMPPERAVLAPRQVHDQVRAALCALWQAGSLADPAAARRQLLKLTRTSWALAYEAVAAAFRDAADAVAWQTATLLDGLCASKAMPQIISLCLQTVFARFRCNLHKRTEPAVHISMWTHAGSPIGISGGLTHCWRWRIRNLKPSKMCGRAVEDGDPAVWQLVLAAWAIYREWVGKVLGLCGLLAECISAEQVLIMSAEHFLVVGHSLLVVSLLARLMRLHTGHGTGHC